MLLNGILFFILGSASTILFLYILLRRYENDPKNISAAVAEIELVGSLKYRFNEINNIVNAQLNLIGQLDRPNASAAHSRYKGNLIASLDELEQKKMDLFKSILADGLDPNVTVVENGSERLVRMSEIVNSYDTKNTSLPSKSLKKTDPINPRTGLKLIVDNNEDNKNDSGTPEIS